VSQVPLLSLVAASVAFMISETATFAGMRERAKNWNPWLGKLASCGYYLAFDFDGQGLSVERSSGIWGRQASPPSP
jgi:hypothetical protein